MSGETALIFGRAASVWDEVVVAKTLTHAFDHVVGVGSAAVDYPDRLDHWVSFHIIPLERVWVPRRRQNGYPDATSYWTSVYKGSVLGRSCRLPLRRVRCDGGSSGMVAVAAMRSIGVERIVLAGIPMTADAGQYDTGAQWREAERYRVYWRDHADELRPYVRSMSGWTREVFGAPTEEWLR